MKTKKEELEAELTRLNALRKQVKEKLKSLPVYNLNRWYKHPNGSLYFINNECENGHLYGYGFDNDGDWSVRNNDNYRFCAFNSVAKKEIILASTEQVEKALIEEAKRRGFTPFYDTFHFEHKLNILYDRFGLGQEVIFSNCKWATIIEQDKFAELKESHRNGAKIEYYWDGKWVYSPEPVWVEQLEYRIKPEEKTDFEVGTKFVLNRSSNKTVFTITEIEDDLVYIGWDGIDNRTYYDYTEVSSKLKNKIWIKHGEPEEKQNIKLRLGRKQQRVILDDNNFGHEVCVFHEKYKHLAHLIIELITNSEKGAN